VFEKYVRVFLRGNAFWSFPNYDHLYYFSGKSLEAGGVGGWASKAQRGQLLIFSPSCNVLYPFASIRAFTSLLHHFTTKLCVLLR
jgi:hypothetical protein